MDRPQSERSIGELLADLTKETSTLVRNEVRLAKAEFAETASHAGAPVKLLGVGAVMTNAGVIGLAAAATLGLAQWLPLWLAALIVGIAFCAAGYLFANKAFSDIKRIDPKPRETIESMKENKLWISHHVR